MEKIEKLEEFNWVSGRDAITIALCNTIIRKQNEIIDHLNSQDQEEENTVCEGCGKTITSRFMQSYTKGDGMHSYCLSCDPEKQDTPEEWDRLRRDGALAFYIELEDWLYEKGYAKGGEIKVPTEVFMQFVSKELKLNSKKK